MMDRNGIGSSGSWVSLTNDVCDAVLCVGIIGATGVTFRPLEESVRDCVESLMSIGGVEPDRTDEWKTSRQARL